jgi:hypothetical protein
MKLMIEKIKNYLKTTGVKEGDFVKFSFLVVSIAVIVSVLLFTSVGTKIGPTIALVLFAILFIILWIIAGLVVFRSLVAASIGLSLIIYINQSYCEPNVVHSANESLRILTSFGLIYVVAQFCINLYKELFGDKKSDDDLKRKGTIAVFKEINNGKHSWLVLVIYIPLISIFVWQVYLVINPIMLSFCTK